MSERYDDDYYQRLFVAAVQVYPHMLRAVRAAGEVVEDEQFEEAALDAMKAAELLLEVWHDTREHHDEVHRQQLNDAYNRAHALHKPPGDHEAKGEGHA